MAWHSSVDASARAAVALVDDEDRVRGALEHHGRRADQRSLRAAQPRSRPASSQPVPGYVIMCDNNTYNNILAFLQSLVLRTAG